MSFGPPVLWLSTNAVQTSLRLRRALFHSSFASSVPFVNFFVPFLFLRFFRSFSVPLFRSPANLVKYFRFVVHSSKLSSSIFRSFSVLQGVSSATIVTFLVGNKPRVGSGSGFGGPGGGSGGPGGGFFLVGSVTALPLILVLSRSI